MVTWIGKLKIHCYLIELGHQIIFHVYFILWVLVWVSSPVCCSSYFHMHVCLTCYVVSAVNSYIDYPKLFCHISWTAIFSWAENSTVSCTVAILIECRDTSSICLVTCIELDVYVPHHLGLNKATTNSQQDILHEPGKPVVEI